LERLRINGSPVQLLVHQRAFRADNARGSAESSFDGRSSSGLVTLGRLPLTDEGLALLTNDSIWAARVAPEVQRLPRAYHVQVARVVSDSVTARLVRGVTDQGDFLAATRAQALSPEGEDASDWIELELREAGRMSPRRLLQAFGIAVLRVRRIGLGPFLLGDLPPGHFRILTPAELATVSR
jgi:23S rRNA pseudouridine2605 synthase